MLAVLGLIDVVMISNLLIMVIVGGYETFVSRLQLDGHRDQPEWLDHVNASVLKVKLGTAIIGISSIHQLKTFIHAGAYDTKVLLWQTVIHLAFVASAMALALTDRLLGLPRSHDTPTLNRTTRRNQPGDERRDRIHAPIAPDSSEPPSTPKLARAGVESWRPCHRRRGRR